MGQSLQQYISYSDYKILMLGLDGVGKTQLLYRLKTKKQIVPNPTTGFNVEILQLKHKRPITIWDIGGQEQKRDLWVHYLQNTQLVMYIIDSTDQDPERIQQSQNELEKLLNYEQLANIPFVILFNKTDLPQAMSNKEIQDIFQISIDLKQIITSHKILAIKTTAISNKSVKQILKLLERVIIGNK
ncbi:ADP-ribosylation_factor [Hexamita inflata]|uniref:ADP-ribosylation factor n=1 Tax=Hexamita inflata TaxID=28002 RepID=A0AA86N7T8_9EUKA|nr:ADP-ribosylation factor [Hexamita inflata]